MIDDRNTLTFEEWLTKELEGKTLDTLDHYGNPLGEGSSLRSVVLRWKTKEEAVEIYGNVSSCELIVNLK